MYFQLIYIDHAHEKARRASAKQQFFRQGENRFRVLVDDCLEPLKLLGRAGGLAGKLDGARLTTHQDPHQDQQAHRERQADREKQRVAPRSDLRQAETVLATARGTSPPAFMTRSASIRRRCSTISSIGRFRCFPRET